MASICFDGNADDDDDDDVLGLQTIMKDATYIKACRLELDLSFLLPKKPCRTKEAPPSS